MKPLFPLALILLLSCKTRPVSSGLSPEAAEDSLCVMYQAGEVQRCTWKGQTVWSCSRNAYDAGSEIFNVKLEQVGQCYHNTGIVSPVCNETDSCVVVWRCHPNIWGRPGVSRKLNGGPR